MARGAGQIFARYSEWRDHLVHGCHHLRERRLATNMLARPYHVAGAASYRSLSSTTNDSVAAHHEHARVGLGQEELLHKLRRPIARPSWLPVVVDRVHPEERAFGTELLYRLHSRHIKGH
eukprot:scaffold92088_cov31-Tisochrysis_lutea.AAC.7